MKTTALLIASLLSTTALAEIDITKPPYNAVGDCIANDTPAFQLAAANHLMYEKIKVPIKCYRVNDSIVFTRPHQLECESRGSTFYVDPAFPTTKDVIAWAPTVTSQGWSIKNCAINNYGNGAGRNGLHLDLTYGAGLYDSHIDNVFIFPMGAGKSIKLTTSPFVPPNPPASIANSDITNSNLESVHLSGVGDKFTLDKNSIGAIGRGWSSLYAWTIPGAGTLRLIGNTLVGDYTCAWLDSGANGTLDGNICESTLGIPNATGALIILSSSGVNPWSNYQLFKNQIQVLPGTNNPLPIFMQTTKSVTIIGGRISVQSGPHVSINGGSTGTLVDVSSIECVTANVIGTCNVNNAGGIGTKIR